MSINKPTTANTAPTRIFLDGKVQNTPQWVKQMKNDSKGRFGASGLALCNNTDQLIPSPPTKHDVDAEGNDVYEHDDDNNSRLSDRGHKDFSAEVTRFLALDKQRRLDDTQLYRHLMDCMSSDSLKEIELHPNYDDFIALTLSNEGDIAVPFLKLVIAAHSSADTLSKFADTLKWINIKHAPGTSLLDTFDAINAGWENLIHNFCGPDKKLDPEVLACLLSVSCLPDEGFKELVQHMLFNNDPGTFTNARKIQATIQSYATSYVASTYVDNVSSQGQAYASAALRKPRQVSFNDVPNYCDTCFIRTGIKFNNHGYGNKPPCRHGPLSPETTTFQPPRAYISAPTQAALPYPPVVYPQHGMHPQHYFYPAPVSNTPLLQAQPQIQQPTGIETACRAFLSQLESGGPAETTTALLAQLYDACA